MSPRPHIRSISEDTRRLLFTVAYAAVAAGSAVAFLWLTNLVHRLGIQRLAALPVPAFALGSLAVITAGSLAAGVLMARVAQGAAGSGVPQLKAAYWKDLGFVRLRAVVVKFVAGVLTLGGGTSLGREGPSVFVGGGAASCLAAALGVPKTARRLPAAAGAAGALAAAFNTPLAGITFVLEEMLNNQFGSGVLGGVVLAAVTGALVVHAALGPQPAFSMPAVTIASWRVYLLVPLVAAVGGLVGRTFQALTLSLRGRVRDHSRLPLWLRPTVGALVTWVLGVAVFAATGHIGVFGLGYGDLSSALNDGVVWQAAGLLVAAKFAATVLSYATGGCGGIFSPTLFLGGLSGIFLGGLAGLWLPLTAEDHIVLAAVGMAACFNAVVRAPLTALLIVFEMTHQFALVPALMVASIVSHAIARVGGKHNFYDELLLQDGHQHIEIKPPRDLESWQNLPIRDIARARPVILTGLETPKVKEAVTRYPYDRFPVVRDGQPLGILTRQEASAALASGRQPSLEPAVVCDPQATVREVGDLLMRSPSGMVLVARGEEILSLVTLHDLLRAQVSLTE